MKSPVKHSFIAPSAQDVADFGAKKSLDLSGFYLFYSAKNWQLNGRFMADWRAVAMGWATVGRVISG